MRPRHPTLKHEARAQRDGARCIAGADEAGRGPLAGPVVACALILETVKFKNRIDDSKLLTANERADAAREIQDKAIIGIGIEGHASIDKLNILRATIRAIKKAVEELPVRPDIVLVDGNMRLRIKVPYKGIIGGDAQSLTIAAASIIAKVTRDEIMARYDRLYPEYDFIHNKGYGTPRHFDAIRRYGPSPIHRMSFSPVKWLK